MTAPEHAPPPPLPPPPPPSVPAALRCSPALLADQVSRLQPVLPARVAAVTPVLNGWRLSFTGAGRARAELLISLQPGALGMVVLDAALRALFEPLPPALDPPPPARAWFPELVGATLMRAFTLPSEPVVVLGFAPPSGGGAPARALVFELFGAAGNGIELALTGRPDSEEAWLEGRVLRCFHPAATARRALLPGESYPPPRATPTAQRDLSAAFDLAAARQDFAEHLHAHWRAQAVDRLARPVRAELTRREKRIAAIAAQAGSAADAARLVLEGQYLQAHPRRGARGFTVIDPRPEHDVWSLTQPIPVKPELTLAENAAKLFQRAQRMRKAADFAAATLPGLEAERAAVHAQLAEVLAINAAAGWPAAAAQITALLERMSANARPGALQPVETLPAGRPPAAALRTAANASPASTGKATAPPERAAPGANVPRFVRRFASSDDWLIDVGKSAKDNHELTFHSAHGNDMLLHVAGSTGAHVIVRCAVKPPKSADPEFPAATLLEAARLCLHFSSRKAAGGEVVYALVKHCKPGGRAGQVMIAKPKYLRVKSDPVALQRILDRKLR